MQKPIPLHPSEMIKRPAGRGRAQHFIDMYIEEMYINFTHFDELSMFQP